MKDTSAFLPFHAINEFMRPDFRLSVIRVTLSELPNLPDNLAKPINRLTKKHVKVPGFRNSEKAPAMVKVIPMSKSFEKSPELVVAILAGWAEIHKELRQQVFEMLMARNWKFLSIGSDTQPETLIQELLHSWGVLPIEVDRTKLPGFYMRWPKGENFETLYSAFTEMYPDAEVSIDRVSLMVVWLSLRLPYQMEEDDEEQDVVEGDLSIDQHSIE